MKCVICNHETQTFYHPSTSICFHECINCKVIFKDPKHWPSEEDELNRYKEHNNSINDEGYVNFLNRFIDQGVNPYIHQGNALDFGSGPEAVQQVCFKIKVLMSCIMILSLSLICLI